MRFAAICALLPFALAVLAALRGRSWTRALFAAVLGVLAAVWLGVSRARCEERVFVIAESHEHLQAALATFRTASANSSIIECALATLSRDRPVRADRHAIWAQTCQPSLAVAVNTPSDAIAMVEATSGSRGRLQRFADWLRGRRYRVVFVVTDARAWHERTWQLSVPSEVARLRSLGITADVIDSNAAAQTEASPKLEIIPHMAFLPMVGEESERFTFDLTIAGDAGTDVSTIEPECLLDGDCFEGADCASGACSANMCTQSAGSDARPPPWILAPEPVPLVRTQGGLRTKAPISLNAFHRGPNSGLGLGWHSLRCRVTHRADAAPLTAQRFVVARYPLFVVVYGAGLERRFSSRVSDGAMLSQLNAQQSEFVASTIFPGPPQFEDELMKLPAPDVPCKQEEGTSYQPICEQAALLVVNDVTPQFWKKYGTWIHERVKNGMNLIVAGAPPKLEECDWLPVFEKGATADKTGAWFDRRPTVTFLLDPSRLGHVLYAPTPSPVATPKRIGADGLDVQLNVIAKITKEKDSGGQVFDAETTGQFSEQSRDDQKRAFRRFERAQAGYAWSEYREMKDATDGGASKMLFDSWIDGRIAAWIGKAPKTGRFGIEDTVVIFAYNVKQAKGAAAGVADLLARGAHVIVVPIRTPYDTLLGGTSDTAPIVSEPQRHAAGPFEYDNPNLNHRYLQYPGAITLGASAGSDAEAAATWLIAQLRQREKAGRMRVQVEQLSRFIDERAFDENDTSPLTFPAISHWGAPLRFQQLEMRPGAVATKLLTMRDDDALHPKPATELDPIPLGYGAVVGQGHVLELGYSLFEGAHDVDDLGFTVAWETDPKARLNVAGQKGRWGPRRILDLAWLTSRLEKRPTETPHVVEIATTTEGALAITVREQISPDGAVFRGMFLRRAASDTDHACTRDATAIDLGLRQLHPAEHKIVFELSPASWQSACPSGECMMLLCPICDGADCAATSDERIFLGPAPRHVANVLDELAVIDQLRLVAVHSGGGMASPLRPIERSVRPLVVVLLAGLLGLMWSRRLARRLPRLREQRRAVPRESSFENARGYLREVGEALGTASTDIAAGAFAGLRPLDPGDKLRAAVREDVIVMAGLAGDIVGPLRVIQRIDERTRRLALVVNVGRSMRRPAIWRRTPEKLQLAAFAADLVAEIAWAARAEIRLILLDGVREPDVQPVASGAPPSQLVMSPRKRPGWVQRLDVSQIEPGENVIYISDYLNETADELVAQIDELEGEGNAVGFVRIVAPSEWRQLDFGVHRGRVFDRTDWGEAQLIRAYSELGAELERDLDACTGGIVELDDKDLQRSLASITNSRLMALLR